MLRRKLAAFVAALLIGLMGVVPAFAGSSSVTDYRLAPGATYCLTPQTALSYADAQGIATGGGAHFTDLQWRGQPNQCGLSCVNSPSFRATFTSSFPQGATFAGKFKLCATNPSTTTNTRISMSLTTS